MSQRQEPRQESAFRYGGVDALCFRNCLISSFSRCISGLAEVGAGAIAMGLGGYLAALPIAVVQRFEKK
jgi:hypothetical protein